MVTLLTLSYSYFGKNSLLFGWAISPFCISQCFPSDYLLRLTESNTLFQQTKVPLILFFLLSSEHEHVHIQYKTSHDHHSTKRQPPTVRQLHIVWVCCQNEARELIVLIRANAHLSILVDERHPLSLIEESELVHAVHIRDMDYLCLTSIPSADRRVVTVILVRAVGQILANIRIQHHKLHLKVVCLRSTRSEKRTT